MLLPVVGSGMGLPVYQLINSFPCAKESFFIRGVYCSFNPFPQLSGAFAALFEWEWSAGIRKSR